MAGRVLSPVEHHVTSGVAIANMSPTWEQPVASLGSMINDRIADGVKLLETPIYTDPNAVIFKAHDKILKRDVAIKVPNLPISGDQSIAKVFFDNMRLAAQLKHRNIISVYGGLLVEHLPLLILEYVHGVTLNTVIEKTDIQPLIKIKRYLLEIGSALMYAHRKGFIHHRLRPHNILIDDEGSPIITPFRIVDMEEEKQPYSYKTDQFIY
jgi:serine/threonine protein kinase